MLYWLVSLHLSTTESLLSFTFANSYCLYASTDFVEVAISLLKLVEMSTFGRFSHFKVLLL